MRTDEKITVAISQNNKNPIQAIRKSKQIDIIPKCGISIVHLKKLR